MPRYVQKRNDPSNTIYKVIVAREQHTGIEPQNGGCYEKWPTADLIYVDPPQSGTDVKAVPIPITPLRILYEWMKTPPPRRIGYSFLHEPLAEQFAKHPRQLVDLFLESVDDFRRFTNENEAFHPKRDAVTAEDRRRRGTTLLQTLAEKKKSIPIIGMDDNETDRYIYLDREIATGRITNADAARRNPAGKGGIDFLLARKLNGQFIPVVAEVKIKYDKTPLLALVQVLTYAAELTSAAQRQRLLNAYQKGPLEGGQLHAGMELLLLFVDLPPHLNAILDLTTTIIEQLCADHRFHKYISRIVVACQPRMPPENGPFELRADEMEEFLAQE